MLRDSISEIRIATENTPSHLIALEREREREREREGERKKQEGIFIFQPLIFRGQMLVLGRVSFSEGIGFGSV